AFLSGLLKENRMIFVARYFHGDAVAAIAKRFSLSENTVSVRLNRLRKALQTYLRKRGYES
ncbi:MAG: sigma-70 family RNA polymerase sigma factor, partial [Lachnospiraceae bacterium]|nr:sigma-70 family RNA polymerase sigma factor [Lachnospiraceae bacterium]